jgi:hypothetical protein
MIAAKTPYATVKSRTASGVMSGIFATVILSPLIPCSEFQVR